MLILITTRVWFIYYDLKYNEALIIHEWWSNVSDQKDWFIKNKNKYGSWSKFMWKIISLFCILWIILCV